jgi:hypothetical protein
MGHSPARFTNTISGVTMKKRTLQKAVSSGRRVRRYGLTVRYFSKREARIGRSFYLPRSLPIFFVGEGVFVFQTIAQPVLQEKEGCS